MNNRKIRVAFFKFSTINYTGGIEKYFINVASELPKRYPEIDISIITLSDWHRNKLKNILSIYYLKKNGKNVTEGEVSDIKNRLRKINYIKISSIFSLKKELQKYDIIYTKNEITDLLLLKIMRYRDLPPVIVGVHTPIYYPFTPSIHAKMHNIIYTGALYKFLLKGTKLIHVLNRDTEKFIINNFGNPVKKIHNPFDIKIFQDNKTKSIFDANKFNIVFLGRMTEQKGIYDLVKIIQRVEKNKFYKHKLRFHIYGDGDLRYIIERLCKISECIKYYGYIKDEEIPVVLKNANVFITLSKWESLPYNILEAQTMGLPVIAYNIPGPRDIIVNNETGLLVNNLDEFIQAIYDFSDGKYKFENISENVAKKFNADRIYNELFEMLISNKK